MVLDHAFHPLDPQSLSRKSSGIVLVLGLQIWLQKSPKTLHRPPKKTRNRAAEVIAMPMAHASTAMPWPRGPRGPHVHRVAHVAMGHGAAHHLARLHGQVNTTHPHVGFCFLFSIAHELLHILHVGVHTCVVCVVVFHCFLNN